MQLIDLETGFRVVRFFLKTLCGKFLFFVLQIMQNASCGTYVVRTCTAPILSPVRQPLHREV